MSEGNWAKEEAANGYSAGYWAKTGPTTLESHPQPSVAAFQRPVTEPAGSVVILLDSSSAAFSDLSSTPGVNVYE